MTVLDKPGDAWGWCMDLKTIHYEDETSAELATDLLEVPFGKYKGWTLSDVIDQGYMEWMLKNAMDKGDVFMEKCVRLRLLEIKD